MKLQAIVLASLGVLSALVIACTAAPASSGGEEPAPSEAAGPASPAPGPGAPGETVSVRAPIDGVEVNIAESFPPQYFLLVRSGLPNGCARFESYEVSRDGDWIGVEVTNLMPADGTVVCTQIYGTTETSIALGSDFEPGRTYTIKVNDVTETLTAQGGGSQVPTINVALDARFQVRLGQTAFVNPAGPEATFAEVLEDSRCPADVTCIQQGRGVILVEVVGEDERYKLRLETGQRDKTHAAGDFSVGLLVLQPYPGTTGRRSIDPSEYVAELFVSEATPESVDVRLDLRAEVVPGESLTVRLVAEIVGGPDNNRELYCHGWRWSFGDGMDVAAMPGCVAWTPDWTFSRHFEQTYTYEAPDTYEVTFSYGPLESRPVTVEVR